MNLLKQLARRILPSFLRFSVLCPKMIRERVISETCMRIAGGPFSGMHYLNNSVGSVLEPKLLGIYERELHGVIEELIAKGPTTIIDIGAAEGYYAVGLALRLMNSKVVAFEMEEVGRHLLAQLAQKNNVQNRIQILGACGTSELNRVLSDSVGTTVVCDVEGAESFLLNPDEVPSITRASILVELHPKKCPGVTELIRSRFESSHEIRVIVQESRTASEFPFMAFPLNFFPQVYIENAVSEFRQPWEDLMEWYWMVPKI